MINIRNIKKKDLVKLSEIYSEVYKVCNVGEKWTKESAYRLLEYWLKRQPDLALLAEYNGDIAGGFVAGIKPWWDGNHLVDGEIFVHPEYQKQGIGNELSKYMYNLAIKKYNITRIDFTTFNMYNFPLNWYKKQGFQEVTGWTIISADVKKLLEKF